MEKEPDFKDKLDKKSFLRRNWFIAMMISSFSGISLIRNELVGSWYDLYRLFIREKPIEVLTPTEAKDLLVGKNKDKSK